MNLATLLATLSLVGLTGGIGNATSVEKLSFRKLAVRSDLVVAGTVLDREEVRLVDGSMAYTFVTFTDLDVLVGSYDDSALTLRFDGGSIGDDQRIIVEGMPEFEAGGRFVLFVLAENGVVPCPIAGWTQGQLRLLPHEELPGVEVLADSNGNPLHVIKKGDFITSLPLSASAHHHDHGDTTHSVVTTDQAGSGAGDSDDPVAINQESDPHFVPAEIKAQRLTLDTLRQKIERVRQRLSSPRNDRERRLVSQMIYLPDPSRLVRSASPVDLPATAEAQESAPPVEAVEPN